MKYRKKPVVIEAMQLENNYDSIVKVVEWVENIDMSTSVIGMNATVRNIQDYGYFINTLEGKMRANFGDYIIKGVQGEFYPCKPDIFEKTYEVAE